MPTPLFLTLLLIAAACLCDPASAQLHQLQQPWPQKINKLTEDFDGYNLLEDQKTTSYKDYYKFIERKKAFETMNSAGLLKSEDVEWFSRKLEENYKRLYKNHLPHYYISRGFDKGE